MVDLVVAELRARKCNVVCVCGHDLVANADVSPNDFACNSLYKLVDRYDIKGIIALSGAMSHRYANKKLAQFLDQFTLPFVAIGDSSPDVTMVTTHDQTGMQELMQHLLNEAEVKKPAFIRGVYGERFTEMREEVYRHELESHGITIDESHFVSGEYDLDKTYDVVWRLLKENPDVDALVACNDAMALGAARAASALGRRIPSDIVISGFDDTEDAIKHLPAITTINQSLDQLASIAVDTLYYQIKHPGEPAQQFEVGTELVVRSSTRRHMPMLNQTGIDHFDLFNEILSQELDEVASPQDIEESDIIVSLWRSLNSNPTDFEQLINRLSPSINSESMQWWSYATHIFDQACQPFLEDPTTRVNAIEVQFYIASIRERIWSLRIDSIFIDSRRLAQSTEAQRNLSSSTRKRDVLSILCDWLEANNVRACFAVRYEKPGKQPDERSELMLSWVNGQAEFVSQPDYPTEQLLPRTHLGVYTCDFMLQVPVYSSGKVYGFLYIDPEGVDLTHFDAIANSFGNALRNRSLLKEMAAQRDKLSSTNEKLERLANIDTLTGLPNRLHAQTWMHKRFKKAKKRSEQLAVLFLDLDGFKAVNDTFGHAAGDSLLCDVSKRLNAVLTNRFQNASYLARLAGDEFIIVLDGIGDSDSLIDVSKYICESLSDPFYFDGERASISVSVGIAIYPDHAYNAESTLKVADSAMYHAKQSGRNRIVLHGLDSVSGAADNDEFDTAA